MTEVPVRTAIELYRPLLLDAARPWVDRSIAVDCYRQLLPVALPEVLHLLRHPPRLVGYGDELDILEISLLSQSQDPMHVLHGR